MTYTARLDTHMRILKDEDLHLVITHIHTHTTISLFLVDEVEVWGDGGGWRQ